MWAECFELQIVMTTRRNNMHKPLFFGDFRTARLHKVLPMTKASDKSLSTMAKYKQIKATLKAANALENPLSGLESLLEFTVKNDDQESEDSTLKIEYATSPLSPEIQKQCLDLFECNMGDLYRQSNWGLDMKEKKDELEHKNAKFLLVTSNDDNDDSIVAFCHFRFDTNDDEDPTEAVLYVYEIQVSSRARRSGLGRRLMTILELVARQVGLTKTMLTVFKQNEQAWKFYTEKLKYKVDEISPSNYGEDVDYEILSKRVR